MSFQGKFKTRALDSFILGGDVVLAARAGTTNNIRVMVYDTDGDILWAKGTDVPTDNTAGYAKGCLFIDTNVSAGTTGLYVNVGTTAECDFDAVSNA